MPSCEILDYLKCRAAILQSTADYVYQLEQEKMRLLEQNCQLSRRMLNSLHINHDSDGSCSDSPLPKRKKRYLDLRNGFFHVDVDEDCRKYTSFIVPDRQFEFNKVPFGLSTSPGVFQRYVSSIFRDLTRKGIVISYLDDLVIPAKDEKEGLEKLKIVFEVAKKSHCGKWNYIKPSAKTQAVRKFPESTTMKQVQSFLGLTGYFRKYIKDYSTIAKPLSNLARKENPFVFGTLQKAAFEKLKNIMSNGPLLCIYKYGRRTELHTDACKQGYGTILLQEAKDGKLHHVYYMSKKTNTAEEKFTWLYPVKTVSAENALEKLKLQQKTFGNSTGIPRGNGQVERIHRTLIQVLTKLSLDDSTKWYKYIDRLQRVLNSTICRSTKWTPFELLIGTKMRNKKHIRIRDLLLEEMAEELQEQREFLRNDAKKNIETIQSEEPKDIQQKKKDSSNVQRRRCSSHPKDSILNWRL
ncbi:retrovirus-related Pol polyprotein from transposon 17.6 [Trichonephila inaurata madagascariensis]|uniref:RNA-directed DNA polymerase n=1 Tax=Trichonephila inaurata madagascariensis TaxID=2747483 RepID=A0A8X6XJZ3_9ARAC|nr:retrovirus-related Pol polyprotein from transposon 17.6 [Trichonephila inaurata madagascariensis]